jgi:hypothetical protein
MITLWLFSIAMENGPFIDGLPITNGDFPWLCYINSQRVNDSVVFTLDAHASGCGFCCLNVYPCVLSRISA